MIFSFGDEENPLELLALLLPAVLASLRRRNCVLILEPRISAWPTWDETKRWQVGEGFIWLAPRARGKISSTCRYERPNIRQFREFLLAL